MLRLYKNVFKKKHGIKRASSASTNVNVKISNLFNSMFACIKLQKFVILPLLLKLHANDAEIDLFFKLC